MYRFFILQKGDKTNLAAKKNSLSDKAHEFKNGMKHIKQLKVKIERWMNTIPSRTQRIIRMKYFEKKLGSRWQVKWVKILPGRACKEDSCHNKRYPT